MVPHYLGSAYGCLQYDKKTGKSYIYYNKDLPKNCKRWNLIHEIGHYTLQHHLLKSKADGYLTAVDMARLEEEANYFAKQVLAPDSLVLIIMAHCNRIDEIFLYMVYRSLFKLGRQASSYCALHMAKYYSYKSINKDIIYQYLVPLEIYERIIKY